MKPKEPIDQLVEMTMAFAKAIYPTEPAIRAVPPVPFSEILAEPLHRSRPTLASSVSERDAIKRRVANFKAHQGRLRREREDYYAQTIAKARELAGRSSQSFARESEGRNSRCWKGQRSARQSCRPKSKDS